MTYKELYLKNEKNKNSNNILYIICYMKTRFFLCKTKNVTENDGVEIYCLSDIAYYIKEGFYIKNINVLKGNILYLKNITLNVQDWMFIKYHIKEVKVIQFKKVDNIDILISKYILLGYKIIQHPKFKGLYLVINDTNIFVLSSCFLKLEEKSGYYLNDLSVEHIYIDNIDFREIVSLRRFFINNSCCKTIEIHNFKTNNCISMQGMFENCIVLEDLIVTDVCTSNVKDMSYMFCNCKSLKTLDLNDFDMRCCKDMSFMFKNCISLETLNINKWKTFNLNEMREFLCGCKSLKKIDMRGVFSNIKSSNITKFKWLDGCDEHISVRIR